jgi:hypothetical protein
MESTIRMENDTAFSADLFETPSAAWRGKPFWSWNGKLELDELVRQIHILKEMGMGGYFMHSRTGLATEYLGQEWFALINACAEEGERLGMESWLYDEDRWPSGTAGGMVTAEPAYQMKFIHLQVFDGASFDCESWWNAQEHPLGVWSCRLENRIDVYDLAKVEKNTACDALTGRRILAFRVIPMPKNAFYNGNTYVDTMKREATEAFLRVTHERYKQHCGHHFGKAIKGIFTDEPSRGSMLSGFSVPHVDGVDATYLAPWTEAAFDVYAERFGEKIADLLPSLFLREKGSPVSVCKARYMEVLQWLFLENFMKPCYDWCGANNLLFTGHVLHENALACQVSTFGSVQRSYPLMHAPGIDYLGEQGRDYWVAKQVDSVARQFGRQWILSELYGGTGWQMNFESHKAIGAWQALFGVNIRCHHLSWYSMAGESKRDYPASMLHHSPWYKDYNTVETWFARLGYFRAQGEPCCRLLVLNPVESLWGRVYPGAIKGMQAVDADIKTLDARYAALFHILAGHQIDFDYGDEALLAENGLVERDNEAVMLRFGNMRYSTVLIAGAETIRASSLLLLRAFREAGGKVVWAGEPPAYLDSLPSAEPAAFAAESARCAFDGDSIVRALDGHIVEKVCIRRKADGTVASDVFSQLRKGANAYYLTVLNVNRHDVQDVEIALSGIPYHVVEEWDLESGSSVQIPAPSGSLCFETRLHTSQARCFRMVAQSQCPMRADARSILAGESIIRLTEPVAYKLTEKNICVLDTPAWSLNGGNREPSNDILRIDQEVRRRAGVPVRGGTMVQPWARGHETYPVLGQLQLRYPVQVAPGALASLAGAELVMEAPLRFTVQVNGSRLDTRKDLGWWVDKAFRRFPIAPEWFREGENEITVSCDFSEDMHLESIYLLGDFAVSLAGTLPSLDRLPEVVRPDSIVEQGFPYYSDSITYCHAVPADLVGKTVLVRVPSYEGAYVKLRSGNACVMLPWRPNEACMTLAQTLEVEVSITRKNTFGPLHMKNAHPGFTGPGSFMPGTGQFSLEPVLLPSGLLASVELLS